ncbi:MAG TPA: GNAT family N-acetyltransferase [Verrucomicrobiae bacterium]|jgi:predicted acetyltransferase
MTWRRATKRDCRMLAELNKQLIADEGHRNEMDVPALEGRMKGWLDEAYEAVVFEEGGETAGYALFLTQPAEVYLRHFFVVRHRRRKGLGRQAMALLRGHIWPRAHRLTVSVLTRNEAGMKFWRAMGCQDYCLTLEILPNPR